MKDVHREEFDLRASSGLDGTTARGRLSAYLGAILLAEVDFAIKVDSLHRSAARGEPQETAAARPYHKIFASYSHKDIEIVRQYEKFVQTLGDQYLRDVRDLRSGQDWDEALSRLIDQADVFQLFWSTNSMRSPFVRREWEYALSLDRSSFIRPTYWELPFPESSDPPLPPDELRRLHFHCLSIPRQSTPGPTLITESGSDFKPDEGGTGSAVRATAGPTRPVTAVLKQVTGRHAGQIIALKPDRVVIGRSPEHCQVVLDSNLVSRRHAEIYRKGDEYYLADLNSRNLTRVNNTNVIPGIDHKLSPGDRINICDDEFLFYPWLLEDARCMESGDTMAVTEGECQDSAEFHTLDASRSNATVSMIKPEVKLRAILEITRNLSTELKIDTVAPKILDSLMELFPQAERLFLFLVDPETKRLVRKAFKYRHAKKSIFSTAIPADELPMSISRTIVNHVLDQKMAVLSQDAGADQNLPTSASIADLKIRSIMCVPLLTPDREALGILQLDASDRKQFQQEDLDVLAAVASQAAIAIQNAQMHESLLERERANRDLKLAEQVQKRFLPQSVPAIAGFEFFAHYDPAYEVGGDYYDFVPLPNIRLAVAVGDVSGRGISSALVMTYCSLTTRSCILSENAPAEAANELNRRLWSAGIEEKFATLILGVLDIPKRILSLISAGHVPVLIRRASGKVDEIGEEIAGWPLGIIPESDYKQTEVNVNPGDVVAIFSDGVTDARNLREELYESRNNRRLLRKLAETQGGPEAVGYAIMQDIREFSSGHEQVDDITLVCFGPIA
jgi:serine phosphatase RsbU (regulator of sigma subunit)